MQKAVLKFGVLCGVVMSACMAFSLWLSSRIGSGHSLVLGYAMMIAAFLIVPLGIRRYRDSELGGHISFGRAFACGFLIALITSVFYVVTWEIAYFKFMPHFMDSYFAAQVQHVQAAGLDAATTAAKIGAIQRSQQSYQNPLINAAYTFMEPMPVGVVVALISAALLRRKSQTRADAAASGDGQAYVSG